MRSTLFFIPHEVLGLPLFGWGWMLGLVAVAAVIWVTVQVRSGRSTSEIASAGLMWILAIPLITIVLPSIEQRLPDGTPIGLPIRGYGVMVLTGLLTGIGITNIRAQRLGVSTDLIVGLGVWMMLGGVIGARLFFVIQKWDTFEGQGVEKLIAILKLTEGGLVIYGGILGGLAAGLYYCYRNRLSVPATADLIVPGFLIGLAFGRIGCLLHGCCFGGVCQADLPTIRFPAGSLPYQAQLHEGELLGIHTRASALPTIIKSVDPGSPADKVEIKPGDELREIRPLMIERAAAENPADPLPMAVEIRTDNAQKRIYPEAMPARSLPVHPSQIYASINALLLCGLIWLWQPFPKRDGIVFCSTILLYALSRFLLEWIRSDEAGQFGTQFTIAQWIAIASGLLAIVGIAVIAKLPARRVWQWA